MFKLISSFLILTSLSWGQEQLLRLRPPFGGLVQNLNPLDIPDNGFTILSNAALVSTGEIYKRGSFSTITISPDTQAIKVDSSSNNPPIQGLYRYYRVNGLRRLLALTMNRSPVDSSQYAHWYWMNDTTGRFAYSYGSGGTSSPDTFSQVEYHKGRIRMQQGPAAVTSAVYIMGDSSTFFLNCSNLSDIKFRNTDGAGTSSGSNDPYYQPYSVYVVNDTLLAIEPDSMIVPSAADTVVNRPYEIHYRSAHNQTSNPTIFHAEAMTYLDTVYFSRGMLDPIGWDGKQTFRANVVDYGMADSLVSDTIVDRKKVWTLNQWAGYWLFARTQNNQQTDYRRWTSSWGRIKGNTANRLTIDSRTAFIQDSAYAIVSMPVDEVVLDRAVKNNAIPGNTQIVIDTVYFNKRNWKTIFATPFYLLFYQSSGTGDNPQVSAFTEDTIYLRNALIDNVVGQITRFKLIRSRFPIAKFIRSYKDRTLWISDSIFQNTIYVSVAGRPGDIVPNTHIVVNPNDGERIQSAWVDEDKIVVGKETKLYAVLNRSIETSGENVDIWQTIPLSTTVGCESPKSICQRDGRAWFFDWPQGFYEMSGGAPEKISEPIRFLVDSITPGARDKVWSVYYPSKRGDLILWGVPINGSLKCNRVLAYSPATKAWSTWNLTNTDSLRVASTLVQEGPGDVGELILGLADSAYVLRYNPDGNQDTLNGQGDGKRTSTFVLTAESKRFELPGQQMRFWEFTPTVNVGATATVNYDFYKNLSSTSLQTLSISHSSGNNNIKKSLSDALIGNQLGFRITTTAAQSFRLGGLDITVAPAGRRLPE